MSHHLRRTKSDHYPLLVDHVPRIGGSLVCLFNFQVLWLTHDEFDKFIHDNWVSELNLKHITKKLAKR